MSLEGKLADVEAAAAGAGDIRRRPRSATFGSTQRRPGGLTLAWAIRDMATPKSGRRFLSNPFSRRR